MTSKKDRDDKVLALHLKDNLKIVEIAERMHISTQSVGRILSFNGVSRPSTKDAVAFWKRNDATLVKFYTTTSMTLSEIGCELDGKVSDTAISRRIKRLIMAEAVSPRRAVVPIAGIPAQPRRDAESGSVMPRKPDVPLPAAVLRAFEPSGQGKSLARLDACGCRWPFDDGTFCGEPIDRSVKRPYCSHHVSISQRRPQSSSPSRPPSWLLPSSVR